MKFNLVDRDMLIKHSHNNGTNHLVTTINTALFEDEKILIDGSAYKK
jgi:hypothetical protein